MHFLCSTFGSSGDVFPVLGLALELKRRNHEVTFLVNEHFRELVERFGIRFEPLGTNAEFQAALNNPDLWHPRRAFKHIFRTLIESAIKQQYDALVRHHRPGETVAIANCLSLGALVAQDKVGLPVITINCQPAVIWSDVQPPRVPGVLGPRWLRRILYNVGERFFIDPVVLPFLNTWRHELGLAPVHRLTRWWHSRYAVVCMFPDWYCPAAPDWPANTLQTDFPLWDEPAEGPLDPAVEAFLATGDPPLVFTPGSANVFGHKFFEAAIEACGRLGRRGILLTRYPAGQVPDELPSGIAHFPFVPFSSLLRRAAAVVHHGGIGSVSQGMAAGIPQLLMPLAHDQFDNAARLQRLSLGDSLPLARFTGPRVTEKLSRILTSEVTATACRMVAQRLAVRDGLARTADAIEQTINAKR